MSIAFNTNCKYHVNPKQHLLFHLPLFTGTGIITKSELKHFYTAFMDVGKLGDKELDDLTSKSFNALASVS